VYSIESCGFRGKPDMLAYRSLLADLRVNPARCTFVEDSARNLRPAKRLRMRTALVSRRARRDAHVDRRARSVLALLRSSRKV
jgi:putative hydrolase of the HAD superfamily